MELKGKLLFKNSTVYVWNGNHEINLFSWLASHGLKDKNVEISVKREVKNNEK